MLKSSFAKELQTKKHFRSTTFGVGIMTGGVDVDWVMFCYVTQECSAEEITDQKNRKQASWTAKKYII